MWGGREDPFTGAEEQPQVPCHMARFVLTPQAGGTACFTHAPISVCVLGQGREWVCSHLQPLKPEAVLSKAKMGKLRSSRTH